MVKQIIQSPLEIYNSAEGADDSKDLFEPINPLKTTTIPALNQQMWMDAPTGETGITATVRPHAEGRDDYEAQDATRTKDETHPDVSLVSQNQAVTSPKILIVEDTQELAEVIQATLESIGLDSVHESHALRGLETFKVMQPDLLLLDIGLPDMTGWKMLDGIKQFSQDGILPTIIVISAFGDPANRLVGKLQGIHSYLIKPFTPNQVQRLVTMALNGELLDASDEASPAR